MDGIKFPLIKQCFVAFFGVYCVPDYKNCLILILSKVFIPIIIILNLPQKY